MKKVIILAAAAALIVCSCGTARTSQNVVNVPTGSSPSTVSSSPTGIKAVVTEGSQCYELQEQKPALRSVGSGTYFKEAGANSAPMLRH